MDKRFIAGIIGIIAVLIIGVLMVISVFRNIGKDSVPEPQITLTDYVNSPSSVSYGSIGSVTGNEDHNEIFITVTPSERRIEIINGYDGIVTASQTYPNNQEAYSAFLSAISGQGFLQDKKTNITDRSAACPTGIRYEYRLSVDNNTLSDLWGVSCDKSGSFNGRADIIKRLFQEQIPDYGKQTTGVRL